MVKFISKKVLLIVLAAVIALGGVIWAIVANIKPTFKSGISTVPAAHTVSGNGTSAVMVDNYLYFVGDKVSTSSIKYGDNDYFADNQVSKAGIYRVAMKYNADDNDATQKIVPDLTGYEYDDTYIDEDGEKQTYDKTDYEHYHQVVTAITDWDNIGKKKATINAVVPKIAGHDQTAMWVFGNTLIYVTPNNLRNSVGELRSSYLDFYRVDLNGKNHRLIYTSAKNLTTDNFTVWASAANQIFILVNENGTLKKINVQNKSVTEIDTDVTNVVFPTINTYRENVVNERLVDVTAGVMGYVYYTKARDTETDAKMGNLLYRYQIAGDQTTEKIGDFGSTDSGREFTPKIAVNGQFIFAGKNLSTGIDSSKALAYHYVVTNDMICQTEDEFEALMPVDLGGSGEITFGAGNVYLQDKKLRAYTIDEQHLLNNTDQMLIITDNVEKILAYYDHLLYVQKANTVEVYDLYHQATAVAMVSLAQPTTTTAEDDAETTDDSSSTVSLPFAVSILLPAHTDGSLSGSSLIYVHRDDAIQIYQTKDGTGVYLKVKKS